ncbi:hypothetical protein Bbelb_165380 [Branchiostoma belcheri]|nr:hypothetical protein Bbelb_165380 [Branchiostoma belcheri]
MELLTCVLPVYMELLTCVLPVYMELLTCVLPVYMELLTCVLPVYMELLTCVLPVYMELLTCVLPVYMELLACVLPVYMELLTCVLPVYMELQTCVLPMYMELLTCVLPVNMELPLSHPEHHIAELLSLPQLVQPAQELLRVRHGPSRQALHPPAAGTNSLHRLDPIGGRVVPWCSGGSCTVSLVQTAISHLVIYGSTKGRGNVTIG